MREIESNTANNWLKAGTITIVSIGEENTYYIDQFEYTYFCKNYPIQQEMDNA